MKKVFYILMLLIPFIFLASCSNEYNVTIYGYDGEIIKLKTNSKINLDSITYPDFYELDGLYTSTDYDTKFNIEEDVKSDLTLYVAFKNKIELSKINDIDNIDLTNYIDNLIKNTSSYIPSWNKEGFKGRWNYIDGVFLKSIIELYKKTNNNKYKDFVIKYVNYYLDQEGNFINPKTNEYSFNSGELDSICESNILFDLYNYTNDIKYLNAIEKTYTELKKVPKTINNINYSHKSSYLNQIWLDGMYMYVPFLIKYANLKNNLDIYNEIKAQYEYIKANMYDEKYKLYYHGHDTTKSIFWANSKTGNSKSFWLRSMGWYILSLADSIELINDNNLKSYFNDLLKEALNNLLMYKDIKTNLYYNLINKGNLAINVFDTYFEGLGNKNYQLNNKYVTRTINNYLEASGSAMISYALLKAAKINNNESFKTEGKKTFEGVYSYLFDGINLNNICITAGLGPQSKPYRDSSLMYYLAETKGINDAKGVGPFIMAYIEYKYNN